jgi:hypothetical protein
MIGLPWIPVLPTFPYPSPSDHRNIRLCGHFPKNPNPKLDPPALLATAAKEVALNIRYPLDCVNQMLHFQVITNEWATDQQAVTGVKIRKAPFWRRLFHR